MRYLTVFLSFTLIASITTGPFAHANELQGPPAPAPGAECKRLYSRIEFKQSYSVVKRFIPGFLSEAKERVLAGEKIKVKDIFDGTREKSISLKLGEVKVVAKTDKAVIAKYYRAFDALMQARVDAGLFPRQDLKEWRKWLEANNSGRPYPKIKNDIILGGMENGSTIAEYFDLMFLDYLEGAKGIETITSVPHYLTSKYPYVYSRYESYAKGKGKTVKKYIYDLVKGGVVLALANTIIIDGLFAPGLDYAKKWGKETGKAGTEKLIELGKMSQTTGPKDFKEKIELLRDLQQQLLSDDFKSLSRSQQLEKLDKLEAKYKEILPEFRDVVQLIEKGFDDKWKVAIKEKLPALSTLRNAYDDKKLTVENINNRIEYRQSKDLPATPEDLERLSYWGKRMRDAEDQILDPVMNWKFYSLAVGDKEKLDPVADKEYSRLHDDYIEAMNIDKYRAKLAAAMDPWIEKLAKWKSEEKGPAGPEKPLPAPGQLDVPVQKPVPFDLNSGFEP